MGVQSMLLLLQTAATVLLLLPLLLQSLLLLLLRAPAVALHWAESSGQEGAGLWAA